MTRIKLANKLVFVAVLACMKWLGVDNTFVDTNQNNKWYAENFKCPEGWTQRCEKCYLMVESGKAWTDARYHCKQLGADLVSIKDSETNMFLTRFAQYHSASAQTVWIGLHDQNEEGHFEWVDNSEVIKQTLRWLPGEPQDTPPGEDCVEAYIRGYQYLWNDAPCNDELPFICQIDGCVNGTERCDNGKCVSKNLICDGIDQCGDNSDEKNCSKSCGGYLYGKGGNFSSPNYPLRYGDNRDCSWIIEVPKDYTIRLTFHAFHVEEGFDYVEVLDGETLASTSLGRYSGLEIPKQLESISRHMRVVLRSDPSDSYSGFFIEYEAVTNSCGNKEIAVAEDYAFTSPYYPANYPHDSKCIWKFNNPDRLKTLTLVVYELDIEKDNDLLQVRDGATDSDHVIGQHSGKISTPIMHLSTHEHLYVKFQSNFAISGKGFSALIRPRCYAEYFQSHGYILSPGFGYQKYPNLARCKWHIREPNGRPISFMFHKFDTERIHDAMDLTSSNGTTIAQYSGQKTIVFAQKYSWILTTVYSEVLITFISDVTYEMEGFNVTYSIGCPPLPKTINGGNITGEYTYGGEVIYSCDKYHSLTNGEKRTCEFGGKWSSPEPFCQEINCGHPDVLENGGFTAVNEQENKAFTTNTILTYFCNIGFKLKGNVNRKCQSNGVWTGTQPVCIVHECEHPGVPTNGLIKAADFKVGSSVEYECLAGYHLVGPKVITCSEEALWSAQTPTCEEINCQIPETPENGQITGTTLNSTSRSVPFGTELNVTCNKGYYLKKSDKKYSLRITTEKVLISSDIIKCSDDSMWTPDVPTCHDVDECQSQSPCSGVGAVCINTIGDFECVCQNGYEKDGKFSCKDINECNDTNSTTSCDQICTNRNGTYECSCKDGYFLYAGNNDTLNRKELHSAIVNHTCFGKECPNPVIPSHGYVINYGTRHPVVLDYRCEQGYILKGNQYVKCLSTLKWDRQFPDCVLAACSEPKNVKNAIYKTSGNKSLSNSGYEPFSSVEYTCNKGYYRAAGNLFRECIHNLTHVFWTGTLPSCEVKSCESNLVIRDGFISLNGTGIYGDVVNYGCVDGYFLVGNSMRTCEADGKWSGEQPTCVGLPCPDPGLPERGWRKGNFAVGEVVTYGCITTGFILQGTRTRHCIYNRGILWTGTLPTCVDITKPAIICSSKLEYVLPRGESAMFVNWFLPNVTDNSGVKELNITVSPNLVSPTYLQAGLNEIVYTATDRNGNNASCSVVIDIKDKEKPLITCPNNLVLVSDLPIKVLYGSDVVSSDNTRIKSVMYAPPNGSIFPSDKHSLVTAVVVDEHGNQESCVFEVYVKGCGCTERECPTYKPYNGSSTCHINSLGVGHVISCNLHCPKGWDFVDKHFTSTENHMCDPKTGWPKKKIPGCAPRTSALSCYDADFTIQYNSTLPDDLVNNVNGLNTIATRLYERLATAHQYCSAGHVEFKQHNINVSLVEDTIQVSFKISTDGNIDRSEIRNVLPVCISAIKDMVKNNLDLLLKAAGEDSYNLFASGLEINFDSCCNNTDHWCCPIGSIKRSHTSFLSGAACYVCTPGMYLNTTANSCMSCPVGTYTSTTGGNEECKICPSGTSTLTEQSSVCTDLCPAGKFSSTGLEPTCRKCDYGFYQPNSGGKQCVRCPDGTTTFERGADRVSSCRASCLSGEISSTGLQPCTKCNLKTYQDEQGKSVCKQCPLGYYGGKEGAKNVGECPTMNPCDQKLCNNSITCIPGNYTFECKCLAGWTGKLCNTDIDECDSSPCGSHGNCTDLVNDYNCSCVEGLTGRNCEVNPTDCKSDSCLNSGVCQDLINDFSCYCPAGFTGKRCEIDVNECESNPCLHGSSCTDLINDFKCNCTAGYKGKKCETNINECEPKPCLNNATCIDLVNDVKCNCQPGYTGRYCTVDIDECAGKPCKNNATCIDMVNDYMCNCRLGFTGYNCSTEVNECDPNPCLQNSTCVDLINQFQCNCEPGYEGDRCEIEKNECDSSPCKGSAVCVDQVNDYNCICPLGYTGKQCETDINECQSNPCQNNGTCIDLTGDYSCTCPIGYTDRNCSTIIDNCQSSPCVNNGTCSNKIGDYQCHCLDGYSGKNCNVDINECKPDPCGGNGNCTDLINDYICYCKVQFRGKNCSELIDNCKPLPCQHNSTCINVYGHDKNDFECKCKLGYYGKRCENETKECETMKPCLNNATCDDLIGDYNCACPTGFTGKNCEINIDDCNNVTCFNGGTCQDLVNGYNCKCPATHKGRHCEKKIPNEVDIKLPGGDKSYIKHSNVSSLDELTLSFWFRSTTPTVTGTLVTLLNSNKTNLRSFFTLKENNIMINVNGQQETFVMQQNLDNKYWHHFYLHISGKTSRLQIVLDDNVVVDTLKVYLANQTFFHPNGIIVLGKRVNATGDLIDDGFKGEISQFAIYDYKLSTMLIEELTQNCTVLNGSVIPWVGLLEGAGQSVELLEKWSCGQNICPTDFTGRFCEVEIDKIPPVVDFCPQSMKIVTAEATTRIYWNEPKFSDDKGVVQILRSHAPGQTFTWGDYKITYIAKDDFQNSAVCTFELYVTPFDCPLLTASSNSKDICGTWKWGRFCDMECNPEYELAVPKPPFYSCGQMGTWSHGPPTYPENPDNLLPACTAIIKPEYKAQNKITYSTTHCEDENFKKNFTEEFKKLIQAVHSTWGICGESCKFDNLRIRCTGSKALYRQKRELSEPQGIEVIFDSNYGTINNRTKRHELQLGVKDLKISMTMSIGGEVISLDVNKTVIAETIQDCRNGSVLKINNCVLCPSGTLKNSTTGKCELCPVGKYSDQPGSSSCTTCAGGTTTRGEGATSSADCLAVCQPGSQFNKTDQTCQKCNVGFYNDRPGFQLCTPCPLGSTTMKTGSTLQKDCSVTCELGEEMINSQCLPCSLGYYRITDSQAECVACPFGKTTYKVGNKDGVCLAKCAVGHELSADGMECMPCDNGYYKDDEKLAKCTACPTDHVTRGYASVNRTDCIKILSSTLYDVKLSFTSLTWNNNMELKSSVEFRRTAHTISKALFTVYENNRYDVLSVVINQLQSGSVVASMTFTFAPAIIDPFKQLRNEIESGSVNGLAVNASSLVTDRCIHFTCPEGNYCWYNRTDAGCACKPGFYRSNDGQKCYLECQAGYCFNGGVCQQSDKGRTCVCSSKYGGSRCEDKNGGNNVGLIVGLILGALLVALLIFCCIKQRQKRGGKTLKRLKEEDVSSTRIEKLKTTPLLDVETRNSQENPTLAFENKIVDFDKPDDDLIPIKPDGKKTESTKITLFLKANPNSNELEMEDVAKPESEAKVYDNEDSPHMTFI